MFTSVRSQTPLVGTVNPQEMALFGSTQPLLCLGCQAEVSQVALRQNVFYIGPFFFEGLSLAFLPLSDKRDRQET